jgi:hypothetical protein
LIQTKDGGYALAGETYSFGAGESDFWLVKVDSSGSIQWNKTYGEATADGANSLIQTKDGGYVLAGYSTDNNKSKNIWFVKTDVIGNMQWNRTYGGDSSWENAYSVVQTNDDGYALAGSTNAYSGEVAYDSWLIKTDSDGTMEWNRSYDGDGGFDYAYALIQTSDSGYIFAGNTGGFLGQNVWVVRTDSEGNRIWDTTWDTPEPGYCSCLIQTNDGYAVTGSTDSLEGYAGFRSYLFLVTVDLSGNIQWNNTYNGLGDNNALFVMQDDDGGYVLAGTTKTTDEETYYDIWFSKADATGKIIPEFPSWTILPLLVSTMVVVIVYKKKLRNKKSTSIFRT